MVKPVVVGLDCGFGFCKGVTDGKEIVFHSVVSSAVQRTFADEEKEGGLDPKHLVVTYLDETFLLESWR